MGKRRIALAAAVLVAVMAVLGGLYVRRQSAGIQATYYVSPTGDDTAGNGSKNHPWKTIQKARDVVQTVNQAMAGDITVYLRGGNYYLDAPIHFGPKDSGTNEHQIIYAGYPGDAMPRIIGGQPLTGWVPDTGNIWKVRVGTDWSFNRLFENGTPGGMARYPNAGSYLQSAGAGKNPRTQLRFQPNDLPDFDFTRTPAQLHAVMVETYAQTLPITAVDRENGEITLSEACDDWLNLGDGTKYYVQGAKEFLDQPGEFFLDHTEGWLYYIPHKTPIEDQEIIAAKTLSDFQLAGTGSAHKVHDITFTGLMVEGTDCKSKIPVFENSIYFSRDALFTLRDAENIVITKSKLFNAGTNAIYLKGDNTETTHCSITDNWFENTGLYGINMIDSGCSHITIHNNLIRNTGIVNSYSSAFTNYNNQYVDFSNNKIDGSVNFAVRGYDAESGRHNNNTVAFNEITNCVTEGSDIAPIHIYRVSGVNNVIRNNLIHDCGNSTSENLGISGIYLDDASCNYTVSGNIIHNIQSGSDMYAIMAKGKHNVIDNNIVYQDRPDLVAGTTAGMVNYDLDQPGKYPVEDITLTHNIYYMPGTSYFYLIWSWDGPWNPNTLTSSDYNLFYFPDGGSYQYGDISNQALPGDGTWSGWTGLWNNRFDRHSVTGQDPLFTDPARNDFRLKAGSPAAALGFAEIDPAQIGLRPSFPWPEAAKRTTRAAEPAPTPTSAATPKPASSHTGLLNGTAVPGAEPVDLTAEGTDDWAHWPGFEHKSAGGSQISDVLIIGKGSGQDYPDDLRTMSWSDGTPKEKDSNRSGIYIKGVGNGFQITAPADTIQRTLTVYVGGWKSSGTLKAALSDNSADEFSDTTAAEPDQYNRVYTFTYKAGTDNQKIVLQWIQASGSGNVTLQGAALQAETATGPDAVEPGR